MRGLGNFAEFRCKRAVLAPMARSFASGSPIRFFGKTRKTSIVGEIAFALYPEFPGFSGVFPAKSWPGHGLNRPSFPYCK